MIITRLCPAKINLFLEVTGKRPNGYHELATLFAKISLADTLTVEATPTEGPAPISLELSGPQAAFIPAGTDNLVCKAAQKFLAHFHLHARIALRLEKHIPTGAGLGGGSSDAAGVLLCLCRLFDKSPLELLPLAAQLGADVPLFLYPDTFLKGEGIGEKLTPVVPAGTLPELVLVYPKVAVSTKEVFARLKISPQQEILTNLSKLNKLIDAVRNGTPFINWKPLLFNKLEEYVFPSVPLVRQALDKLACVSGGVCRMSGSGSTVFALVGTNLDALKTAKQLKDTEMLVYPVSFYKEPASANYRNKDSSDGRRTLKSLC